MQEVLAIEAVLLEAVVAGMVELAAGTVVFCSAQDLSELRLVRSVQRLVRSVFAVVQAEQSLAWHHDEQS